MHGVAGNVKVMCEAHEWAKLYAVTPWSESRPGLVLNRISLDQWLAFTPPELVTAHLRTDPQFINSLRKEKVPVVPA